MAGDPKYLAFIRKLPCCCCGAPPPSHAHHHTVGRTVAARAGRQPAGLRRGIGQKSDDTETMALCLKCHGHLHDLRGFFSGYTAGELREWQDIQVKLCRQAYEAYLAERDENDDAPPVVGMPVPSSVDTFDVEGAAANFLAEYEGRGGPQAHHDLVRLLRAAIKAARDGRAA